MTFSNLTARRIITRKYSSRGGNRVTRLIIHHTAGGTNTGNEYELALNTNRSASVNYVLRTDGSFTGIVPEESRAWTSGSFNADKNAITVETVNTTGAPSWQVADIQLERLAQLAADVSRRYGLGAIVVGKNLYGHRDWYQTACPGPYLYPRLDDIAKRANQLLGGSAPAHPAGTAVSRAHITVDGSAGPATIRLWQRIMGTAADGIVSGQLVPDQKSYWRPNLYSGIVTYGGYGSQLIRAVQRKLGLKQDGLLGPATIKAIQRYLGVAQDASFGPATVRALQARLNTGEF